MKGNLSMSIPINDRTQQEKYADAQKKVIDAYNAINELTYENQQKLTQETMEAIMMVEMMKRFTVM